MKPVDKGSPYAICVQLTDAFMPEHVQSGGPGVPG